MNGILTLPQWVKVWAFLIGGVGFPVFSATYYMARDAGWIPSHAASMAAAQDIAERQGELLRSHDAKLDALVNKLSLGLRIICENAAVDHAARNNCANIR